MNELLSIENITKNYKIERELGRGGMGIVYLATDKRLDRFVAIKVLNLSALEDTAGADVSEIIERFNREAKAVAKLTHPNIVNIYDIGSEKNLHYMVMEYLEGIDLSKVKNRAKLEINQIVKIGIQICKALDFAHQMGIIHRDIKTANIILGSNNTAKLMDFGIASLNKEGNMRLTQEGSVLGSLMYISPEQLTNAKDVGAQADLYSLGVTLYELLCGRLPFLGDNVATLVMNILKDKPEPASTFNPDISPKLDKIIAKALEKSLEERYQNADEFGRDLTRFLNAETGTTAEPEDEPRGNIERRQLEEDLKREKEKLRHEIEQIEKQREELLRVEEQRQQNQQFEEELRRQKEKARLEKQRIEREKEDEELKKAREIQAQKEKQTNSNVFNFSQPKIVNKEKPKDVTKEIQKNQAMFDKAKKYIEEEDYDAAIGSLRTLLDMQPKVAEYHSYLGLALAKKGWDGYAQAEFKVALHHDPSDKVAIEYYKSSQENPVKPVTPNNTDKLSGNINAESDPLRTTFMGKFKNLFKG